MVHSVGIQLDTQQVLHELKGDESFLACEPAKVVPIWILIMLPEFTYMIAVNQGENACMEG